MTDTDMPAGSKCLELVNRSASPRWPRYEPCDRVATGYGRDAGLTGDDAPKTYCTMHLTMFRRRQERLNIEQAENDERWRQRMAERDLFALFGIECGRFTDLLEAAKEATARFRAQFDG